jgi:serine/threonine-protein kinase
MRPLDPAIWRQVGPLLDRALEVDADGRKRLLEEVRTQQPEVATVLQQLISEHERLEQSAFLHAPPSLRAAFSPAFEGTVIGAYTLEAPLGAGGMGSVWRARRSDGRFEGAVAVKLLHLGVLDAGGAERFRREGTLLARLAHPHIARLLDAGITPTGQPYLVLEYVEGKRIDVFADANQLDVRARLGLFLQVAEAVAHAHAHLIVHRDLKPSNILVDSNGQVKLLDFGIAKLLDDSPTATQVTFPGEVPLTPAYAAPEQVRGEEVTTATDVYALGVLLYELLVARHPTGAGCTTPMDLARALVEVDPTIPSAALSAAGVDSTAIAVARATTATALSRTLKGDLDNILVMALQKPPERRYAGATAFASDVARYLRDEPVVARADRWSYRAGKFVRRHRAAVAAVAGLVLTLTAATAITANRMIEARRQRDEATFQARRAQASSEFMRNLVTQIGTTPMTMRQVLDRGREALEKQYAHDPAFVARMLTLLSGPYIEIGDDETARAMMDRALELATKIDDPAMIASYRCTKARDATDVNDFAAAHVHLAEARRQIARLPASTTGPVVECEISESEVADGEERFDDAVEHANRAVTMLEREGNTASTRYTSAVHNLAWMYNAAGRFGDAVAAQRKVGEVTRQIGRGHTITMIVSLGNQGRYERASGWWLDAERSYHEGLDLVAGAKAEGAQGGLMAGYARVLANLGRSADAKEWAQRTIATPKVAARFVNGARLTLASVLIEEGNLPGAREAFEPAERVLRSTATPAERAMLVLLDAQFDAAEGQLDAARAKIAEGLKADGYPTRVSPFADEMLEYGARLALKAGDHRQAAQLARDAIGACERYFDGGKASAFTGRAEMTLGLALLAGGQRAEGQTALRQAVDAIAASAGAEHPWLREARAQLTN